MHELSICRAIATTVTRHAEGRRVDRVQLRIGHFRQVVPDTLAFCWELQTRGTELEGCVLDVEDVPAVVSCDACGARSTLEVPVLRCAECGDVGVDLLSGEEFLIDSIEVSDPVDRAAPSPAGTEAR